ncbi:MAG: phosphomethylpyrimidine synthase ThiC, partial [Candidatus Thermoplasmatota archaeon]|nr:phosphomethylpyrimidine synthase ThiC [Candidatus Thermoplasmatota archaeon]
MALERLALKLQEEIKQVAKDERIDPAKLKKLILEGRVVIPFNPRHSPRPLGIGEKLRVKINTNIGTSPDYVNIDEEIEKAKTAVKYKTDAIMDLSIGGNIDEIRKKILKTVNLPLGTVPIYQAGMEYAKKG